VWVTIARKLKRRLGSVKFRDKAVLASPRNYLALVEKVEALRGKQPMAASVPNMSNLKRWIRAARLEAYAIYLTLGDRRVPWHVQAFALCVAAYALSPIDLLPDFIPVVGYGDDWIVVTLGSLAVVQLLPLEVIAEHRAVAAIASERNT
jgi:uncharacterized membrane protein YkvA (DUF1232 family)